MLVLESAQIFKLQSITRRPNDRKQLSNSVCHVLRFGGSSRNDMVLRSGTALAFKRGPFPSHMEAVLHNASLAS